MKITDKIVKRSSYFGRGGDKYLIFTKYNSKKEVLENTDSLLEWKFNSSDIYGEIKKGKIYEMKVYGWRFRPFSWYRNIVDVKEVKDK